MVYNGWSVTKQEALDNWRAAQRIRKWQSLSRDLRNEVQMRQVDGLHHADCKCQLDDYFEIVHCNCGFDDLLDKLDEHGYTDVELERLFPDGYIY